MYIVTDEMKVEINTKFQNLIFKIPSYLILSNYQCMMKLRQQTKQNVSIYSVEVIANLNS